MSLTVTAPRAAAAARGRLVPAAIPRWTNRAAIAKLRDPRAITQRCRARPAISPGASIRSASAIACIVCLPSIPRRRLAASGAASSVAPTAPLPHPMNRAALSAESLSMTGSWHLRRPTRPLRDRPFTEPPIDTYTRSCAPFNAFSPLPTRASRRSYYFSPAAGRKEVQGITTRHS